MDPEGSITRCIQRLNEGDDSVAQREIFNRYFARLVTLARQRVARTTRAVEDEEDVAMSAMDSFFRRMNKGQFELSNRSELWSLLITMTLRKSVNQFKKYTAKRRMHQPADSGTDDVNVQLDQLILQEPTADLAIQLAEDCTRRLESLPDLNLRKVAIMKLEGYSNTEIAAALDVTERTVGRKLHLIRRLWTSSPDIDSPESKMMAE